jgi:hypothetical protein
LIFYGSRLRAIVVRPARLRSWLGAQPQRFSSALADWADEARFEIHEDRALQMGAVREVLPDQQGRSDRQLTRDAAIGNVIGRALSWGPKLPVVIQA